MRRIGLYLFTFIILQSVAGRAEAQERWMLDLRGGANTTTGDFVNSDRLTGVGLEGSLSFDVVSAVALYAGWDWQHHGETDSVFGQKLDVEDTGYAFGVRYVAPVSARAKPWLRLGALYNHVELEDTAGDLTADSQHTWGWEVGAGVQLRLSNSWQLTPGVRYRRFEPAIRFGGGETPTTLEYLTVDVGFALKF